MPYAEKRDGRLTGRYIAEMRKHGFPKRAFDSRKSAEGYEAYVNATGHEPVGASGTPTSEHTFKSVAEALRAAGGPKGRWAKGRDKSVLQRLDGLCAMPLGSLPITEVTYTRVEDAVLTLQRERGISDATVNRYLTPVSAVLKYAEQRELIPRSPSLPWRAKVDHYQPTYSQTQERAVLDALRASGHDVDAFMVRLLLISGMRIGELLGLRAEQIEDGFVSLDDPRKIKNGTRRELYIGEENEARLRALVRANELTTYQQFRIHLRDAIKKCGYEIPRPVHALRHTTATRTVADEQDVHMAMELLGHRNINTTLGYRKISKEVLRARAKKLHPQCGSDEAPVAEVLPYERAKSL
jgi:integrase